MKAKSEKQVRAIIAKVAGSHVAESIKQDEIKLFVGCNIQEIGGRTHVQGCYYKEITPRGFVDAYGELSTFAELFDNEENGAILDKYNA
jgi:hypothetical protein